MSYLETIRTSHRLDLSDTLDSYRRFDRGPQFPASRKKHKCTDRSHECGSICLPLKKRCKKESLGDAQTRLKKIKRFGAGEELTAKAKASIVELSSGQRAQLSKAKTDRLKEKLKRRSEAPPSGLAEIDPKDIAVDPKRFQYKIIGQHTASGEVGSLAGVGKYDPNLAGILQVWRDPGDGKTYVVNGHNRLALAKKLGAGKVAVRYLDSADHKTARSIGALTNIAEGRGDALDSAKFFRDSGITREDLAKKGIPMREKIAQDGLSLSKLDDTLFRKTIDGEIPIARASIIGGSGLDHTQQRDLSTLIDREGKRRNLTDGAISEMVDIAKSSSTRQEQTLSLFGEESVSKSSLIEKAQLQSAIKKRLSREKKLFGTVAKSSAASDLERGGNSIDRKQSGDISEKADRALNTFDKLKGLSGPISSAINSAADRVAKGENAKKVEKELYDTILNSDAFGNLKKRSDSAILTKIQAVLETHGLAHRFDAYDVWLHMDEFIRKAGIKKGGGKCGRGWVGIRGSCKRMAKGGDRKALEKHALNKFAENQRSGKKLDEKNFVKLRRSIAGKSSHPVGSPAHEKEQLRVKYGGGAIGRTERLMQKEEMRSIVSQGGLKQRKANNMAGVQEFDHVNPSRKPKARPDSGRTPVQKHKDKQVASMIAHGMRDDPANEKIVRSQLKDFAKQAKSGATSDERKSGAVMRDRMESALSKHEAFKAKQKTPIPIEQGRSLKSLFSEADRIGSKYQDGPTSLTDRRMAKQGADRILNETGLTESMARGTGKVRSIGTPLTTQNVNPFNARQGRQLAEQQASQSKSEGRSADAKSWADEARRKSRSEMATLIQGKSANQQNLFGVTEHSSDMPLFNQPKKPRSRKP